MENNNTFVGPVKESKRYSFKNQFGSFTSVFVFVNQKDLSNFTIETKVRSNDSVKIINKVLPIDKWDLFHEDLYKRLN
jgi:hypothetical protein